MLNILLKILKTITILVSTAILLFLGSIVSIGFLYIVLPPVLNSPLSPYILGAIFLYSFIYIILKTQLPQHEE